MGGNNKFIDKFSNVAMRVGGQIHLKALRDTFATIMPLYILAGVAVLINNVVLPFILKGNALVNAQYWGTVITNGWHQSSLICYHKVNDLKTHWQQRSSHYQV